MPEEVSSGINGWHGGPNQLSSPAMVFKSISRFSQKNVDWRMGCEMIAYVRRWGNQCCKFGVSINCKQQLWLHPCCYGYSFRTETAHSFGTVNRYFHWNSFVGVHYQELWTSFSQSELSVHPDRDIKQNIFIVLQNIFIVLHHINIYLCCYNIYLVIKHLCDSIFIVIT